MGYQSRNADYLQPRQRGSMRWSPMSARANRPRPPFPHAREHSQSSYLTGVPASRVSPEQHRLSQRAPPVNYFEYSHGQRFSPERHRHTQRVLSVAELKHVSASQSFPDQRIDPIYFPSFVTIPPAPATIHHPREMSQSFHLTGVPASRVSPEQHRLSQHGPPVKVFDYGHVQRLSPEQQLPSQHGHPISTLKSVSSSRTSPDQRIAATNCPPFTTLPPTPALQASPEQHILSLYASPALEYNRSCLEFIQTARTYAQLHVRIGIEKTGKPFRIPPVVRKISGSHLYKVEFHWGFTTSKTYTVNISDVGTIEKEYDDTHSAEIRSSIKPEAVKAQIPPSLREQPY